MWWLHHLKKWKSQIFKVMDKINHLLRGHEMNQVQFLLSICLFREPWIFYLKIERTFVTKALRFLKGLSNAGYTPTVGVAAAPESGVAIPSPSEPRGWMLSPSPSLSEEKYWEFPDELHVEVEFCKDGCNGREDGGWSVFKNMFNIGISLSLLLSDCCFWCSSFFCCSSFVLQSACRR